MAQKGSREAYILDRLAKDGSLSVAALSRDLGVSEVTIRTSLKQLEARGLLARTHGGAQASSFQASNLPRTWSTLHSIELLFMEGVHTTSTI